VTPRVATYFFAVCVGRGANSTDSAVVAFRTAGRLFFGSSNRAHEVWSLRMAPGSALATDPRYTPTSCFETFPLPWPPGQEPWRDRASTRSRMRRTPWTRRGAPTSTRWTRRRRGSEEAARLTNLYNERPGVAVDAARGPRRRRLGCVRVDRPSDPASVPDDLILTRLLASTGSELTYWRVFSEKESHVLATW